MNILLICTGNICRSPMAEGALRQLLTTEDFLQGQTEVTIESAGIAAMTGTPATANAVTAARQAGVDIMDHMATHLSEKHNRTADLVLTMTDQHWYSATEYIDRSKVWTLKGYPDKKSDAGDIDDPYGGSLGTYIDTYQEIMSELTRIAPALRKFISSQ